MSGQQTADTDIDVVLGVLIVGMVTVGALRVAAMTCAWIDGDGLPSGRPLGELTAFSHAADPSAAWGAPVGPPWLYWTASAVALMLLAVLLLGAWRVFHHPRPSASPADPLRIEGLATRQSVRATAGPKPLVAQAQVLRPSLPRARPADVGWCLGTSRGVACWTGVRDSLVVLGPPGAGKGLNVVIPAILDAPGAVITTSTRPDNLTATLTARAGGNRPVGVFDPEGLATGVPSILRWSPIRGCDRPQTAMIRAAALTANAGESVTEGSFWKQQTATAVRCLLHAAALGGRPPASLYRWSLSAPAAKEAVSILVDTPGACPQWDKALDAIIAADQRQRDSVWAMVANAFTALADPHVLQTVTPTPNETFEPAEFLQRQGTLYLLGTSTGAAATASLIAALIEDIIDVARRLAAASPGARLDPPLALILDEAANYPLPSLGPLMSEGGGSGLPTTVVLQSLAQARDRWGKETAGAIWDSATAKIILPGLSNADDLADISRLLGERNVTEESRHYQAGNHSTSISERKQPILDPSAIRTLKAGHALLLLRAARPILLDLHPWTARRDARRLQDDRHHLEDLIRRTANRHRPDAA